MDPQTGDLIKWLTGTLGITAVFMVCFAALMGLLLIAGIAPFALFFRNRVRRTREIALRASQAMPATAKVVESRSSSSRHSSRLIARVELDVQLPEGETYRASAHWLVDYLAAPRLQPGESVAVRIDREDPSIVYPDAPWAQYTDSRILNPGRRARLESA